MHIGGMRTALFNWLWARRNKGQFVLRIDDTDRERNIDEALGPILQAFRWLRLDWDEGPEVGGPHGPYFQSERGDLYRQAVDQLLADGKAYRDFDAPELVKADREAAEREQRNYINVRRSLELSPTRIQQLLKDGHRHVIRLLIPRDEVVFIDDVVRGRVEWDCGLISDPVIVRGDGSPLYNLATVIDDAQMQISHVIRAEEHLSNTAVQALLHQALGHQLPTFAHIPYVAAPGSKEKLSKRKLESYRNNPGFRKMFEAADRVFSRIGILNESSPDPVMVEYYQRIGYLPDSVFNALARLGWSLDDKTEILSRQTVVDNFTVERVIKAPAGLDPDKLQSYQVHWMNELPQDRKIDGCMEFLVAAGLVDSDPEPERRSYIGRVIAAAGDRIKLFSDILDFDDFLIADDQLPYDEKAVEKRLRKPQDAVDLLREFRSRLELAESFDADALDKLLHDFVDERGIGIGRIIHALRVAVTGKARGPGMFDCLALLGRERSLARIDQTLARVST